MLVYDDAICGCGAPTMCTPHDTFAFTPRFTDKHPLHKVFDDGNDTPVNFWSPQRYVNGDPENNWWVPVAAMFPHDSFPASDRGHVFASEVPDLIQKSIVHFEELYEKNIVVAFPTTSHNSADSLSADHTYVRTDMPTQVNVIFDMLELSGGGKREHWASAGPYRWIVPTIEPINVNDTLAVCPAAGGRLVSVRGHGGNYSWWEVHNPNGWMPLKAVPYYSVGHHPGFVDTLLTALSVRNGENLRYAPYFTDNDYMCVLEVDFYINDEHPNVPMTVHMVNNSVQVENRAGKRIEVVAVYGHEVADVARVMAVVETNLTEQEWFDVYQEAVECDARDSYSNKHTLSTFVTEAKGCPSKLRTIHAVTVNR